MKPQEKATELVTYPNAVECKRKNKRVAVVDKDEDSIIIVLKNYSDSVNFKCVDYKKLRKNLFINGLHLTKSTAEMLQLALNEYLTQGQKNA